MKLLFPNGEHVPTEITDGLTLVGSAPDCEIRLRAPGIAAQHCDISIPIDEISRQHAKLQVVPDGVMVEDLGSANGTYVNSQRVHGSVLLRPGEELRFDTVRFLLLSPSVETKAAPAAAAAAPVA